MLFQILFSLICCWDFPVSPQGRYYPFPLILQEYYHDDHFYIPSSLYSIITIMLRVWLRWANTPTCLSSLCHWLALELCDHRLQQTSMIINLLEKISWSLSLFLLWLLLSQQSQDHIYTVPFLEACLFLISHVEFWEIKEWKGNNQVCTSCPPLQVTSLCPHIVVGKPSVWLLPCLPIDA